MHPTPIGTMWNRLLIIAFFALLFGLSGMARAQSDPDAEDPASAEASAPESESEPESSTDPAAEAEAPPDSATESEVAPEPARPARWKPPEPSPKSYDWIRLKSGEWLKGEIVRVRDDTLRFDSDELDELDLDWEDIPAFRSPRLHTYIFEGRRIFTGTAVMQDGRITLAMADGEEREFDRDKLVSIVSGDQSERSWWSGKLSLGLIARTGNTESTDFNTTFEIKREAPVTRFSIDYTGNTSSQDGSLTASNNRADLAFDIYVSRRFFVTAPSFNFYRDEFQNIEYQLSPGLGVGYDLLKKKWIDWEIGGGAAYQHTQFISTTVDQGASSDVALLASTSLDFDFPSGIELDNSYQLQLVVTNPGLTAQHLLSTLSFDIWGPLDLDVSFSWDRVQDPVTAADGTTPESDDLRLSVGIGIEF